MQDEIIKNKDRYFLEGTIESFEQKSAVIITKDGQRLLWPISNLPEDCEISTLVRIILTTGMEDEKERENIAKTILNKILKTDIKGNEN